MSLLRTLPKRNRNKKISYYDQPIPPLPSKKPRTRIKNVFLKPPFKTYIQLQKEQGLQLKCQDENEFYPLIINQFQVENGQKYIFCDISTLEGHAKNVPVFKHNILKEFWLSAIIGYEEQLVKIGWITPSELKSYEIEDGDSYNIVSWQERDKHGSSDH